MDNGEFKNPPKEFDTPPKEYRIPPEFYEYTERGGESKAKKKIIECFKRSICTDDLFLDRFPISPADIQ